MQTHLTIYPHEPGAAEALDAMLARLREAILGSDECALTVVPPRPDGFGNKKMVGMATIWFETFPAKTPARNAHEWPPKTTSFTRGVFADWLDEHGEPERAAMFRTGVVRRPRVDYPHGDTALTLSAGEVSGISVNSGCHTRTHGDGWTITGQVHEDYFTCWVNDFVATHPVLGRVEGDFERLVFASSEGAFRDFYERHTPESWDYGDI